ncbi:hypothetical protein POM88_050390 [Heracleum sosnowskyi]|uniref:Reverse transcriptase zinc-binding domain-containing protein n=1 Tax=Heracleum sosnowskyi TaxID=360622 RepID=A0AAD8GZP5_9APIA|nr:hypothetical protein POM88_050390 [Heracleum sosnowskyi]
MPSKCPWSARKILNARPLALTHLHYHVGQNSRFFLWHDPLVHNRPLLEQFDHSITSTMDLPIRSRAGQIINNGEWIRFSTNHVDAMALRHLLNTTTIVDQDYITWDDMRAKWVKCSSIYHSLRISADPPDWIGKIRHPYAIPRCSITLWLALKNRLLTKDRMINFGMLVTNGNCVLCHCMLETAQHLFMDCPYTSALLTGILWPIVNKWQDLLDGNFLIGTTTRVKKLCSYL